MSGMLNAAAIAAENSSSVGIEGFYNELKTSGSNVDGYFGSITGNFSRNWTGFFAALDLRASYGEYSNTQNNPLELEERPRIGYSFGAFSPYSGLGARELFTGGNSTYQFYVPIGATYGFQTDGGWIVAPNAEYDILLLNHQESVSGSNGGWGARGSLMIGMPGNGTSWQVGPFVRYWHFDESKESSYSQTEAGLNIRLFW